MARMPVIPLFSPLAPGGRSDERRVRIATVHARLRLHRLYEDGTIYRHWKGGEVVMETYSDQMDSPVPPVAFKHLGGQIY